jgi:hypothetical protein
MCFCSLFVAHWCFWVISTKFVLDSSGNEVELTKNVGTILSGFKLDNNSHLGKSFFWCCLICFKKHRSSLCCSVPCNTIFLIRNLNQTFLSFFYLFVLLYFRFGSEEWLAVSRESQCHIFHADRFFLQWRCSPGQCHSVSLIQNNYRNIILLFPLTHRL